jgi:hypothetical protein
MSRILLTPFAGLLVSLFFTSTRLDAAISQLYSPVEIGGASTIDFDGFFEYAIADSLYASEGVLFTRDDGKPIYLYDWAALERTTTSPDFVLATIATTASPTFVGHLNVSFDQPIHQVGAYFGNDMNFAQLAGVRLSAYDVAGELLGAVAVTANDNTSVDQFIGLQSSTPVGSVRFDNLLANGEVSSRLAVVIDDLSYSPVPEPSTIVLLVLSAGLLGVMRRSVSIRRER